MLFDAGKDKTLPLGEQSYPHAVVLDLPKGSEHRGNHVYLSMSTQAQLFFPTYETGDLEPVALSEPINVGYLLK